MANVHHRVNTHDEFAEVTVIEASARRWYFPREQNARIVEERMDPAVSVSAVAHRHGLNPNQLFTWRRRLRQQITRRRSGTAAESVSGDDEHTVFTRTGRFEVETAGAGIRVDAGVDEPALARVGAALRRAAP